MPAGSGNDDEFAAATPEELRAAVAELRAAVRARDDFIAVAAHELRNPMTPIAGQIRLLLAAARRGGSPPQVVAGLERLEVAVWRYIRRATTLLDISRASSGQLRLEPAAVDVSALVRETAQAYAPLAERAGCPLRLDVQDGVVATLDRLAVEQVLDNLLSNALKFGAGKPIDVGLAREGAAGLALTVRDRGAGLSEEDRARVFGRFEQAVGQRRHGGFGVGLWLAQRLVGAMGGAVAVESRPGQGATFTVRLPWRMVEAAEDGEGRG